MKKICRVSLVAFVLMWGVQSLFPANAASSPRQRPKPSAPPFWEDDSFQAMLDKSGKLGRKGITVVAPASGLDAKNTRRAYAIAEKLGVSFPKGAIDQDLVPYNANSDEIRLKQLRDALSDPGTEVVWALRGGYGSNRLLAALAGMKAPEKPKVFIGYSDMTFLHLFLQRWNWRTVHAGMFWELTLAGDEKDADAFLALAALLAGQTKELRYDGLRPFNRAARDMSQPLKAAVTGGNLTCVAAAVGTPWCLQADGKILFLEDVKEKGYKIDRMLSQLRDAGLLDNVAAVILGSFTEGDEDTEYSLARFAGDFAKPVFRTELFGHGEKNFPLVFNSPASIERTADNDKADFTLRMEGL